MFRSGSAPIVRFVGVSNNGLVLEPTALDDVIQRIGAEIYRRGSCLVSPEELILIYNGAEDDSKRFACIRDIAMRYHWAFELPGRMTSVIFKELPAAEPQFMPRDPTIAPNTSQPALK